MQRVNNVRAIAFTELLMQCVLFLSICYTCYLGILKLDQAHFIDAYWVIIAVIAAFAARKCIRKFSLFVISNLLIIAVAVITSLRAGEGQITFNLMEAALICIYSTSLKNREVNIYKDNSIPIREGQSAETVREAAIRSLVAKEAVDIYFLLVIVVGYFVGMAAGSILLMNIQGVLCILFIVLQIIHNNLKYLKQEYDLNGEKKDFPTEQMKSVSGFVTVISVVLVSFGMAVFYSGYYGNIFTYIGAGFKFIIRMFLKLIIFLMGLSGSSDMQQTIEQTTAATVEEFAVPAADDNDFMELLAEIFGMVLIAAIVIGVIYIIKVYASNFNRVKKLGTDTVEYVAPTEKKERVSLYGSMSKYKEAKSDKNIRKMYKKQVLNGMKGKAVDSTLTPGKLTKTAITEDDIKASRITSIYEKARYSDESVTQEEYDNFKRNLKE